MVGTLMYLVNTTRWDIGYAVTVLSRAMSAPTSAHLVATKRVLRYLRGTPDLPTTFRNGPLLLTGFSDSDFAAETDYHRSCTGFLYFLGGGVISSGSILQKLVAQSTTEAELIALQTTAKEGVYLLNLLRELDFQLDSFKIASDSQTALSLASQRMFSARTKHIATKYNFLRDLAADGDMILNFVPTSLQLADLLTKHLPRLQFLSLRAMIQDFGSTGEPRG